MKHTQTTAWSIICTNMYKLRLNTQIGLKERIKQPSKAGMLLVWAWFLPFSLSLSCALSQNHGTHSDFFAGFVIVTSLLGIIWG